MLHAIAFQLRYSDKICLEIGMNFVSHDLIHGFLGEADILIILKFHKLFF